MTPSLFLDLRGLLSSLVQNIGQVLLLLIVDERSLLRAIDLVVLHIDWSFHCLILPVGTSATLVILMMDRFGS